MIKKKAEAEADLFSNQPLFGLVLLHGLALFGLALLQGLARQHFVRSSGALDSVGN
jgi:hypothetical protein